MSLSYDEVFTMFFRIGCLAVFCGLAGMDHDASAAGPAVPAGITVVHDIPYRVPVYRHFHLCPLLFALKPCPAR